MLSLKFEYSYLLTLKARGMDRVIKAETMGAELSDRTKAMMARWKVMGDLQKESKIPKTHPKFSEEITRRVEENKKSECPDAPMKTPRGTGTSKDVACAKRCLF